MQLEAVELNIMPQKTFLKNNTFKIRGWYAKSATTKNDISFARSLRTTPFRKKVLVSIKRLSGAWKISKVSMWHNSDAGPTPESRRKDYHL